MVSGKISVFLWTFLVVISLFLILILWLIVLCLFTFPRHDNMESHKSSERQHLLERLLEAVKQVTYQFIHVQLYMYSVYVIVCMYVHMYVLCAFLFLI